MKDLRLLTLGLATAAGFATTIPCWTATAFAATPSTSKAATKAADDEPGAHDTRFSDTELGRALASIDKDPRKAVAAFEALQAKMPWLEDVLDYHAAVAKGRYDAAAARRELEAFLGKFSDSVLLGDAAAELSRLVEADGDTARAVSLAERYGRGGDDGSSAAAVCLSAGRLLADRDAERAYPWLQCARTKAPLSNPARTAYDLVQDLRRDNPGLRPSGPEGLMAEAKLLGRENRGEQQAATLRDLLERYPGSSVDGEAALLYGRVLGKTDSKAAGAEFFEKRAASATGARKAKLLYEAATLRWNDDRNDEAEREFQQMLALKTGIGDEQQALYALARINDAENRREAAISYYGRAAAAATGATRAESKWRQGWVSYRAKDFATAERTFDAMAENAPRNSDTDGRPDALYWQGRSLERLGRKDDALACFRKVLTEFPVGYYAAAADRHLGRRATTSDPAEDPVPPAELPPAASIAIRRAKTMREAGLVALASRDLAARLARFDAGTRRAVLPALPAAGAYDAAFRIAIQMNDAGQLSKDDSRVYFYPRAHAAIVESEARKAGIPPTLVWALMRQESAFSTTAVSSAKAVGLMQMLESTAVRVASESGLPKPSADDLFDPAVNIRLGVRYLAQLSKQFDGNVALMAAAYNAGEKAATRWQDLARKWDEDEMIEQISYRETRGYVKAILRNMRNYRAIYGNRLD